MFKLYIGLIVGLLTCCSPTVTSMSPTRSVSPKSFGLLNAKSGEERYLVLLKTHKFANENGLTVDYRGIGSIELSIPSNAESIPLGPENDFAGAVFNVSNRANDIYLFVYKNKAETIDLSSSFIDQGIFSAISQLNSGVRLLVIEDKNPWVNNRSGHSYGHQRRDVLLIKNGRAENSVIKPYHNQYSSPACKYYTIKDPHLIIKNLTFNRSENCSAKTYLCAITGVDNVQINGVRVNTPSSKMVGDYIINLTDCTNVSLVNLYINGTYSSSNHSGYGVSMNNIWRFNASNLIGKANWGIFGNNNISEVFIKDSSINRFDIHCYGRDLFFENVHFTKSYNQFSSVFGEIAFTNCTFSDFIPVLYESSYNVYCEHSLIFSDCTFNITKNHNYLIDIGVLSSDRNSRAELYKKSWPHLIIKNMLVNVPKGIQNMSIYHVRKQVLKENSIDLIPEIEIDGMDFQYEDDAAPIDLYISTNSVVTDSGVSISLNKVYLLPKNFESDGASISRNGRIHISVDSRDTNRRVSVTRSRIADQL